MGGLLERVCPDDLSLFNAAARAVDVDAAAMRIRGGLRERLEGGGEARPTYPTWERVAQIHRIVQEGARSKDGGGVPPLTALGNRAGVALRGEPDGLGIPRWVDGQGTIDVPEVRDVAVVQEPRLCIDGRGLLEGVGCIWGAPQAPQVDWEGRRGR